MQKLFNSVKLLGIINQIFKLSLVSGNIYEFEIYKVLAILILFYGSESWTISGTDEGRLILAKMR
jgi:hypothetical protein